MVKTFKDYYKDDEFKKKHQAYMLESIECECGCKVMRSNISKHRKTPKHKKMMDKKDTSINEKTYNFLLKKLKEDLNLK